MATIGFIHVRDAQAALSAIVWGLRDAIAKGDTPYETDVMEVWKQHLITATAMLSDMQAMMEDEWRQEIEDAKNIRC